MRFWAILEFGQIVSQGAANAARLIFSVEDPDSGPTADASTTLKVVVGSLTHLEKKIDKAAEIARRARKNEVARRRMTVPGIGPLIATAVAVLLSPPETFRKARGLA